MVERVIKVTNETGLHARPATMLVKECTKYKSDIKLQLGDKLAEGKSILGLMSLGLTHNDEFVIRAHGEDELMAIENIEKFFSELED